MAAWRLKSWGLSFTPPRSRPFHDRSGRLVVEPNYVLAAQNFSGTHFFQDFNSGSVRLVKQNT